VTPPRGLTNGQVVGALTAPMPGKILSVEVGHGDRVSRGQTLVILEAMKMKNAIKSPYDGVVLEIKVRPDQTVAHGDLLLQLGEE
jgi:biotin carboxyl carrier protein